MPVLFAATAFFVAALGVLGDPVVARGPVGVSSRCQDPLPDPDELGERERKIRALFLRHFCKYVRWPAEVFPATDAPLVVGVVGEDVLGDALDDAMRGFVTEDGRSVVVRRLGPYPRLEDDAALRLCQVLLVTEADPLVQGQVIRALRGSPVLLVSEAPGFVDAGGGIQTFLVRNKLRFEVNRAALDSRGLVASSKLLRLSRDAPPRPPAPSPTPRRQGR